MSEHATDRELLEAAAKAAGVGLLGWSESWADEPGIKGFQTEDFDRWNPLDDDGDALRLAVKLEIHITISEFKRTVCRQGSDFRSIEEHGTDPYAATRRAIVRAAASMAPKGADSTMGEPR